MKFCYTYEWNCFQQTFFYKFPQNELQYYTGENLYYIDAIQFHSKSSWYEQIFDIKKEFNFAEFKFSAQST